MTEFQYTGLKDLYLISSTPFCIIDQKGKEISAFPEEFGGIYKQEFYLTLIADLKRCPDKGTVLEWYLNECQFLAIAHLCNDHYLVTAPVSAEIFQTTRHSYLEYVCSSKLGFFHNFIQDIPPRANFSLSRAVMLGKQLYSGTCTQANICIKFYPSHEIVPLYHKDSESSRKLSAFQPQKSFCSSFHMQNLKNCIKNGDFPAFLNAYHRPVDGLFGTISHTAMQQTRYSYVLLLYMIASSAAESGMPYEYCFDLFSHYCLKMEALRESSQIEKLKMTAADDFCRKVVECRTEQSYHKSTKESIKYIRRHLYQKIRIQDIALHVHLNRSTLSAYFKQDTGQTITEFITAAKLEESKYLLEDFQNNYQQIIDLLGFCSQSYFIQKFRAYFGITPHQYLKSAAMRKESAHQKTIS